MTYQRVGRKTDAQSASDDATLRAQLEDGTSMKELEERTGLGRNAIMRKMARFGDVLSFRTVGSGTSAPHYILNTRKLTVRRRTRKTGKDDG